jgi:PTEN phosphatase family protein
MEADPGNVIAVHCKGGKGRTGTMICIWLLESRECSNAKEALNKFGDRRTNWDKGNIFQGVETPSQSRFVGYYDIITNKLNGLLPSIVTLKLKKVVIYSINGIGNSDGSDLSMIVYRNDKSTAVSCTFSTNTNCKVEKKDRFFVNAVNYFFKIFFNYKSIRIQKSKIRRLSMT